MARVIKPTKLTDAILISSSVAENDYPAWVSGTTYTVGQRVIRTTTHSVYERAVAGAGTTPPENSLTGTAPVWLYVQPTNRWAMFDTEIGTATTGAAALTVVIQPGVISAVSLFGLVGESVTVSMTVSGSTVYTTTRSLQEVVAATWYEYLFSVPQQRATETFSAIPAYLAGIITITITGSAPQCGACIFGLMYGIGGTKRGVSYGIKSYSKIITDAWGSTTFFKRRSARPMSLLLRIDNAKLSQVTQIMESLESEICVWVGSDVDDEFDVLTVLGWFDDFSVAIPYKTYSDMTLKIQGTI
jgi:hypothetical protein